MSLRILPGGGNTPGFMIYKEYTEDLINIAVIQ